MLRFLSKRNYLFNFSIISPRRSYTNEVEHFDELSEVALREERILPPFESHANIHTVVPIFKKASIYLERTALCDEYGRYSYYGLAKGTKSISKLIDEALQSRVGERVVFLCPNNAHYILTQWAIWMSGQTAVPLSPLHPPEMIQYYVNDCKANLLISTPKFAYIMDEVARKTQKQLIVIDDSVRRNLFTEDDMMTEENLGELGHPLEFYQNRSALIIYTSGTTGKPKGVVLTHKNLQNQILTLIKSWRWTHSDSILHTLPLHHIHGIVNALMCPLYVGAKCVMHPKFDVNKVWSHLLRIHVKPEDHVNIFMAVPTVYTKLIREYDKIFKTNPKMIEYVRETLRNKMRLMVSGSASLPNLVFNRWNTISGHKLLERYGMTETGMTISNVYDEMDAKVNYCFGQTSGEQTQTVESTELSMTTKTGSISVPYSFTSAVREPGYVGLPLPGVSIRLAERIRGNEYRTILECSGRTVNQPFVIFNYLEDKLIKYIKDLENQTQTSQDKIPLEEDNYPSGEILVKSDSVFKEYFGRNAETNIEFTDDGWFRTGDTAMYDPVKKLFKILGRSNVDIIKTGGYKISSLTIETVLLEHPDVKEIVVVGLPDAVWGEKVAAIVVCHDEQKKTMTELAAWGKSKLPNYCIPKIIRVVQSIPRNAMGKINKKQVIENYFPEYVKRV